MCSAESVLTLEYSIAHNCFVSYQNLEKNVNIEFLNLKFYLGRNCGPTKNHEMVLYTEYRINQNFPNDHQFIFITA